MLRLVWRDLRTRHRETPLFAIVAYGKLGGKELGYASDLDLIFLHDDTAPEAAENYARLAQRLNNWLTSLTPAGVLYETDLRLRPDGVERPAGELARGLRANISASKAWVWEHQALTRARFVAGDADIGARVRGDPHRRPAPAARSRARCAPRSSPCATRCSTRTRTRAAASTSSTTAAALIDVEFIVQYLVLGYSHAARGADRQHRQPRAAQARGAARA